MIKRLGMWNRLAFVSAVLVTALLPLYAIQQEVKADMKARDTMLKLCRETIPPSPDVREYLKRDERCFDEFTRPYPSRSLGVYAELASYTALLCAILYGLLWSAVATIRWIWAGRKNNS